MEKNKLFIFVIYLEIVLLIGMTFSISFFINEALSEIPNPPDNNKNNLSFTRIVLLTIGKIIFNEKNIVSALEQEDLQYGIATCLESKNGEICQEYLPSECQNNCKTACIPTSANETSACSIGTCFDKETGACTLGSPKASCEKYSGTWSNDPYGNIPACKQGCCFIGGKTDFTTQRGCSYNSQRAGVPFSFKSEINTELACLSEAQQQEEGACIFQEEFEKNCKFTKKSECLQLRGKFASGYLCSAKELGTNCREQQRTACAEDNSGNNKVYWFDSCGNRENIYSANKAESWNKGRVLSESDSCSLNSGNNPLAYQGTCGNCNYLLGSICGAKTSREKLLDSTQEFVCKDLSCIDEEGKKHKQGESWCAFQGAIGVDNGRSADSVGSRHYRKTCLNGEIRTDPCQDYRNEICVSEITKLSNGNSISSAACRINLAYQCYEYNKKDKKAQCEKNPDCFIKKVNVAKNFKFDICVPKYKPGFSLEDRGDGVEGICNIGTQKCQYVKIKKIGGSKKINKECIEEKFTQQMNDLCMSLGDCGAQVNYQGDLSTDGYKVLKGRKLGSVYLEGIGKYADESLFRNQRADPGAEYFSELGIPGVLGQANLKDGFNSKGVNTASSLIGVAGIAAYAAAHSGIVGGISGPLAAVTTAGSGTSVAIAGASSALAGAAVGLALTSFLIEKTGVGRGIPPALSYGLMAAGAAGGAMLGLAFAGVGTGAGGAAGISGLLAVGIVPVIGWIILAVVIIIIVVLKVLGIGKTKKVTVTFQCKPWQAPLGGKNCGKCGQDGFPCGKYACESLGQTCQFINEEEKGIGECADINPNDVTPPVITPLTNLLPQDYRIEKFDSGISIKSSESDGCIKETYQPILLGISLDEPGQCRMDLNRTASFEEMEFDFGINSRFLRNHTLPLNIPSLESLGLDDFNPYAKSDYNLYVRCQDKSGNINEAEYAINFCIKQGPDTTPPIIEGREPFLEQVSFNTSFLNASVFTNEPAECRWDLLDRDYNSMINNLTCEDDFEDDFVDNVRPILGFECKTEFPVSKNDSLFYVRCLDQPWLPDENISLRNANQQSYEFKIKKSSHPLKIDSINVDGKNFTFAQEPSSLYVEVRTSGGLDGTARCYYKLGNATDEFHGSYTLLHKYTFQTLFSGNYFLPVRCEDLIGNIAEKTAEFSIKIDNDYPKATRLYAQSGNLILVTHEPASCAFRTEGLRRDDACAFTFSNATVMSGQEYVHSIPFDNAFPYYIKCKDAFEHVPGDCTTIVQRGDALPEIL